MGPLLSAFGVCSNKMLYISCIYAKCFKVAVAQSMFYPLRFNVIFFYMHGTPTNRGQLLQFGWNVLAKLFRDDGPCKPRDYSISVRHHFVIL